MSSQAGEYDTRRGEANRSGQRLRMLMLTQGAWDHASSRERAARYRVLLEGTGEWTVHWLPRVPEQPRSALQRLRFAVTKRVLAARRAALIAFGQWDLVYVQRLFLSPRLLSILKRRRVPLVYDFDDAIYLNGPGRPSNDVKTATMIQAAERVIVSTDELVTFCNAHGITPSIITTPVDTDWISPADSQDEMGPCVIGWIGSASTTPYLNRIASALAVVAERCQIRLLTVGASPSHLDLPGVPVSIEPWSFEQEPALIRRMSVGIMPLPDDEWARGKGGYKLLLYMSAGLPVIASPVGINREIVRNGETGFLAASEETWIEALYSLCAQPELRKKMGRAGRALAVQKYSREVCFGQLRQCLEEVVEGGRQNG